MNKNQKMYFSSSNDCIEGFNRIFCSWGIRKLFKDDNRNLRGYIAPLWINPTPGLYTLVYVSTFIAFILQLVGYIAILIYNSNNKITDVADGS